MKRSLVFLIALHLAAPILRAQKQKKESPVLFTVNQKPVYADEFEYVYRKNNPHRESKATKADIDNYLDLFINFKLKVAEAEKRGMDTTQSFHEEFDKYHDELIKPYLPENRLIDSLTTLTYQRLKVEIKASHILVACGEDASPEDTLTAYHKALAIKQKIQSGASFDSLAVTNSDDPSVRSNKGELGYFTALQMIFPFEDAAYKAQVGEVVGPVRTRFGYHLIRVEDRRPSSGRVEVSHIMIRTGGNHSVEDAHRLINDAYAELQQGKGWNEVCRKYSEDPNTKNEGGRLKPFGLRDMAGVPTFEEQAFALKEPGSYSQPFQTAFGWHIVRLERKLPLASFDELKDDLSQQVSHDERASMSREVLLKGLERRFQWQENKAIKQALWSMADTTLQQGRWKPDFMQQDSTLFRITGKPVHAGEFLSYVANHQQPNRVSPESYLDYLYQNFVDDKLKNAQEQFMIAHNEAYRFLLKEYHEGILLFDIMEKEVWDKASADTTGQRKYFDSHQSSYQYGVRVHATLYKGSNAATVDSLAALKEQGADSLTASYVSEKGLTVETGDYEKKDRQVLDSIPFAVGTYTVQADGNYYLVTVNKLIPPGPKPYDDARAAVVSDYQDQLEKAWVSELKSEFQVQVNAKTKKQVYRELL